MQPGALHARLGGAQKGLPKAGQSATGGDGCTRRGIGRCSMNWMHGAPFWVDPARRTLRSGVRLAAAQLVRWRGGGARRQGCGRLALQLNRRMVRANARPPPPACRPAPRLPRLLRVRPRRNGAPRLAAAGADNSGGRAAGGGGARWRRPHCCPVARLRTFTPVTVWRRRARRCAPPRAAWRGGEARGSRRYAAPHHTTERRPWRRRRRRAGGAGGRAGGAREGARVDLDLLTTVAGAARGERLSVEVSQSCATSVARVRLSESTEDKGPQARASRRHTQRLFCAVPAVP